MEDVGYLSNIIENHDEPRGVSHYLPSYGQNERGKKLLAAMYFMLKGLPFIYQGQELGMENKVFSSIEEIDDISTKEEYRRCLEVGYDKDQALKAAGHYSRDNARTPFQWSDEPNGGFTKGEPWLGINDNYRRINAREQMGRDDSVWAFYRQLIALREHATYGDTVVYGRTEPVLEEERNIMAYFRRGEGQDILVIGNFDEEPKMVTIAGIKEQGQVLLNNCGSVDMDGGRIRLESCQAVVIGYGKKY